MGNIKGISNVTFAFKSSNLIRKGITYINRYLSFPDSRIKSKA